jgi:hypothetical protein
MMDGSNISIALRYARAPVIIMKISCNNPTGKIYLIKKTAQPIIKVATSGFPTLCK